MTSSLTLADLNEESKMKKIHLTMSSAYVSDWGFWEAIRELAQNSLDHRDATGERITVGYHKQTETVLITSSNYKLTQSSLILGATEKSDDDTVRGKFGEGYKLALIVLLRLGLDIKIYNQDELWIPCFEYSEAFSADLLTIKIYPRDTNSKELVFAIKGTTRDMALKIKDRLIINRDTSIGFKTDYGTILTEERFKGKVFAGGLYVSTPDLELKHGFDFDPEHVQLGRDRGLIDSFDVQWLASKMWLSIKKDDTSALAAAVDSIYTGSPSANYVGSFGKRNSQINESVATKFYDEHPPTAVPVTTETEAKRAVRDYDNAIPVIVPSSVQRVVKDSARYKEARAKLKERVSLTPNEHINNILSKYKTDLGPMYKILVEELIPLSVHWIDTADVSVDENTATKPGA